MKSFDNELVYHRMFKVRRKICEHLGVRLYERVAIYFVQAGIYNEFDNGFIADELDKIIRTIK